MEGFEKQTSLGRICFKSSHFNNSQNASKDFQKSILQHQLNFSFEILIPLEEVNEKSEVKQEGKDEKRRFQSFFDGIRSMHLDNAHQFLCRARLSTLIEKKFLDNYVRRGSFCALSLTEIDHSNSFAIVPEGKLLIRLDKLTYEKFGIDGKKLGFDSSRFQITIDLKQKSFEPGKKNYDRLALCLQKLQPITFICCWEPPTSESELFFFFWD